jgi:hypothetical protein
MPETERKTVCIINGSLRGKNAASLAFARDLERYLPADVFETISVGVKARVKDRYPEATLKNIARADALVLIFPLHNYGLPGGLMRLLEEYYGYAKAGKDYKRAGVYVIVNCAFPRPAAVNGEVLRVVHNFCARLSLQWRFAVCIGTGPVVVMTRKVPFFYRTLKKAYADIARDILSEDLEEKKDYFIKPIIPEPIIAAIRRHYERSGKMIEA